MDVYLDLLPEEKKGEIKKNKTFRMVICQEIRLLIPLIVFVFTLLAVNFNLKFQLVGIEKIQALEQSQEKYQELKIYEDKFRDTNSQAVLALSLQSGHLRWSPILREIAEAVPEGVNLKKLETKEYFVSLSGAARTREEFLTFEEKIKSSACFSEVNTPLSNLVSKENVVFQIDFKVNDNCLKSE